MPVLHVIYRRNLPGIVMPRMVIQESSQVLPKPRLNSMATTVPPRRKVLLASCHSDFEHPTASRDKLQRAVPRLMAQKPWIVSIPGTTNIDHLRENMDTENVGLTPADLREIENGFSRIEIYGGRIDAMQMAQIGQD